MSFLSMYVEFDGKIDVGKYFEKITAGKLTAISTEKKI